MTPFGCRITSTSRTVMCGSTETRKKVTNHRGQSQNKQSGFERTCPTCVVPHSTCMPTCVPTIGFIHNMYINMHMHLCTSASANFQLCICMHACSCAAVHACHLYCPFYLYFILFNPNKFRPEFSDCVCVCICVCDANKMAAWTGNLGNSSETVVFLLTGGVLCTQGPSRAGVVALRWQRSLLSCHTFIPDTITALDIFALWPSVARAPSCACSRVVRHGTGHPTPFDSLLASKTGPHAGCCLGPAQHPSRARCTEECVCSRVCMMFAYLCALQIKLDSFSLIN